MPFLNTEQCLDIGAAAANMTDVFADTKLQMEQNSSKMIGTAATQMVEGGQLPFTASWETQLEEQDQAGSGGEGDKTGGTEQT